MGGRVNAVSESRHCYEIRIAEPDNAQASHFLRTWTDRIGDLGKADG